jgi:hypothetical protein
MLKHTFEKCLVALGLLNLLPVLVACADDVRTPIAPLPNLGSPGVGVSGLGHDGGLDVPSD